MSTAELIDFVRREAIGLENHAKFVAEGHGEKYAKPSRERAAKFRAILALLVGIAASGCTQTITVDPACTVLREVSFSAPRSGEAETAENRFDTRQTIDEVRAQNAAIRSLCGK